MPSTTALGRSTEPANGSAFDQAWSTSTERRKTPRASLHWTVHLTFSGFTHPFHTKTRDISRDGFYCLLNQPVTPGERIKCDIVLPTHNSVDTGEVVYLRCRAQVVRVEKSGDETDAEFGVACRIEDYCVVHGNEAL